MSVVCICGACLLTARVVGLVHGTFSWAFQWGSNEVGGLGYHELVI